MGVDVKKVEEYEQKSKKLIFDKIREIQNVQFEILNVLSKAVKLIDNRDLEFSNVGTLTNNKVIELNKEFEKHGLSMFSYTMDEIGVVTMPIISEIIFTDMIAYMTKANMTLSDYSIKLQKVLNMNLKEMEEYESKLEKFEASSSVSKGITKIKSIFSPIKRFKITINDNDREELNNLEKRYKEETDVIWNYKIDNKLADSLVEYLIDEYPKKEIVLFVFETKVTPYLNKLGLNDVFIQATSKLNEVYKEKDKIIISEDTVLKYNNIISENDKNLENFEMPGKSR